MLFIFFNSCAQLLRVFTVKTYSQLHDNFTRFDKRTRSNQGIATLIELDATVGAETTMTIGQVQLIVLVTPYRWHRWLTFEVAARVQHFDPLQHLAQVAVMRARVADHAAAKRPRNAWAEL